MPVEQAAYARSLRDAAVMLDVDRQTIRLHAGELSPQEMRTVLAVLGWKRREMASRAERLVQLVENDQAAT